MDDGHFERTRIEVTVLSDHYLKQAAALFTQNYRRVNQRGMAPSKYENDEVVFGLLAKELRSGSTGVVAHMDGRMVGYLLGASIGAFKGSNKGVYTPEWGHAATAVYARDIYNTMYEKVISWWHKEGAVSHAITIFSAQTELISHWVWNGYGMLVVDALRESHQPVSYQANQNVMVRVAETRDVPQLCEILKEHIDFLREGPTFLHVSEINVEDEVEEWFQDANRIVWIAETNGEISGFMHTVSNGTNACTIVRDSNTLSIQSTHVSRRWQRFGVATAMLSHVHEYAISHGYKRLSVDFESANQKATRYWMRFFDPICYSLIRYVDDRTLSYRP